VAPAFQRWVGQQADGAVLFVLHGDVICALLHRLLGFPGSRIHEYLVRPCSLTKLERGKHGYALATFNQAIE
jgi:broad specificity phosphatase PhoE